ncbi:MAG: copper chaperone PCu(A)C [Nitrososphaeraceae archaeon]|nr:copper chaperone PCu(A)C [Nitrososphaeraceae archaeon]
MILLLIINLLFTPVKENINITDTWMRPNGKGMATALYFKINNTGSISDTLYKVESNLAQKIEIHETYESGDVMGMREVENIIIDPKTSFELKPGSHHIMLLKLKQDIKIGDKGEFILYFKIVGKITITAVAK